MKKSVRRLTCLGVVLLAWGGLALPVAAQQVLLDLPVRAGELVLFPGVQDENSYYYVSDKPRLATNEEGTPQFSFIRFVDNVRTGAEEAEAREGEGGGILHCLVALSVTPEQIQDAQRELQRVRSGATIVGPVLFKSGRFALISSFTDPEGGLSRKVVGLGAAPILDGEKAAVSMLLTKQGATILWQSFQTPTPDISFSFEMELDGYRSPKRALIEANFDQIYEHQGFAAGIASQYLAAEIKGSFDDLQRTGAIKVTQTGEDAKMEELISTAYKKLTDMMFQPAGGTGTPSLASLAGAGRPGSSMLDRATTMLQKNRQEAERENQAIRRENTAAEERFRQQEAARRRTEQTAAAGSSGTSSGTTGGTSTGTGSTSSGSSSGSSTSSSASSGSSSGSDDVPASERPRYSQSQPAAEGAYTRDRIASQPSGPARREEVDKPAFAIVASFEMKKVRQRGTFRIDLNKYTTDTITLRFDENIGDLRRFWGDENFFRQFNTDDPLYRQREISVFLDGLNSADFDQYVNFVTVQMRKIHAGGDETSDEVRIDRNNFNSAGNAFKMLYGWKGDEDRRRWLDYEYRTKWSFHGGHEMEEDWTSSIFAALNVAPPVERRMVELEADPDLVGEAGIRAITVEVFYQVGEEERSKRATLSPSKDRLSERIEYLALPGEYEYDYEITWRLTGNRSVSSGRQSSTEGMLFVDELPTS